MAERLVKAVALAALLFLLGLLIYTCTLRMRYPFELEWLEGATMEHVMRLLEGKGIYTEPSIEFVPFLYTPFYYIAGAAASLLLGPSLASLRLLSFLSTLAALILVYLIVLKFSSSPSAAFAAAALYAGCFKACGAWMDLARVDSLFVALLLLGLYLFIRGSKASLAASAAAFALAIFTKQAAALPAAALWLYGLLAERKRYSIFLLLFPLFTLLPAALFQLATRGWFLYYTVKIPLHHETDPSLYLGFWSRDLFKNIPIILLFAVLFLLKGKNAPVKVFFLAVLLMSWSLRVHSGSFKNDLMALFAAAALLAGLSFAMLRKFSEGRLLFWSGLLLQALLLLYNPKPFLPTKADVAAGKKFLSLIKNFNGPVYLPSHSFIVRLAGKGQSFAHIMAVEDVRRADPERGEKLLKQLCRAFSRKKFAAVLLDAPLRQPGLQRCLEASYRGRKLKLGRGCDLCTRSGLVRKPVLLYIPEKGK